MGTPHKSRVGLALGGGSARGWAHIGVIRALEQTGICPDVVCGTSIGALVGAAYAAGELDRFEQWVLRLGVGDIVAFMDVTLRSGLFRGRRLMDFFRRQFNDRPIEELAIPFAAVATALQSGAEIWLRSGSTLDAVRASIAMPGLFTPIVRDRVLLVDGGLVNPVPVSLARAMGADVVIAVDLCSDLLGRHLRAEPVSDGLADVISDWIHKLQGERGIAVAARCGGGNDAIPARSFGLESQHHAGPNRPQPHGRGTTGHHRGAAAGASSPARLSPGK